MFPEIDAQFWPFNLTDDVRVEMVSAENAFTIIQPIISEVFGELNDLGLYVSAEPNPSDQQKALRKSMHIHRSYLVFYNQANDVIGWSFGEQADSTTFFMRWSGILPSYQNKGLYKVFTRHFLRYLEAVGYERVTSNHFATNRPVLIAKMKVGFFINGMMLDERWGAVVYLLYTIDEAREEGFCNAFSLERYERQTE